jgi:hypothetical protein
MTKYRCHIHRIVRKKDTLIEQQSRVGSKSRLRKTITPSKGSLLKLLSPIVLAYFANLSPMLFSLYLGISTIKKCIKYIELFFIRNRSHNQISFCCHGYMVKPYVSAYNDVMPNCTILSVHLLYCKN